jgi:putative membrane protein
MVSALLLQQGEWKAVGHGIERAWTTWLGDGLAWAFVALVGLLVLRALWQARRYRALGVLASSDVESLRQAVADVERRTIGEVVPVILERSDRHPSAAWLAALSFAVGGSLFGARWIPWHEPALVLLAQLALGGLGWALAELLPGFRRAFVSEARAEELAEEQALQEFHGLGLQRTRQESGVLILVSLFERRVVVLADRGIDAKVGSERWAAVDQAVLEGLARGSLREGLLEGVRIAGELLAQHFPARAGDVNEIPDRVVVRRE